MKARLIESHEIAHEVRHFTFEVPEIENCRICLANSCRLRARRRERRLRERTRQRLSPSGNRFELCLNRVQDGFFSPFLFDLQPGDTVDMKGPYGYFTWRQPVSDSILVATGTGIAPFRGMMHGYLAGGGEREITLVYGVRYEPSLLYREEFERLAKLTRTSDFCRR